MEERNWKYKITSSWTAVIAVAITTVVSGGFTFWLYTAHDGAFVGLGGLTAFFAIICVLSEYGAMSFKVLVGESGFYFRTKPGNGRYYRYGDILDCCLVEAERGTRRHETYYAYYMKFTDRANRTHRVLYDKSLYEREMNELVARIERAKEDEE